MIILKWLIKCISTGLSFFLLIWPFSPKPACWFLRNVFRFGTMIPPKNYKAVYATTRIVRGLCYDPACNKGELDLILPVARHGPLPVIFWLHGGAYIGGDKTDVEAYAVLLAARGYAVVNMNYPLAPESPYPRGVQSVPKAYLWVGEHAAEYGLDLSRVYFAGDSAGAQMAAQFITAQADPAYAEKTGVSRVVPFETIRGAVLFCGLYDAPSYAKKFDSHTPVSYVVKRVFWGVTGNKNWRHGPEIEESAVLRHIPGRFPPTFLTDGNFETFSTQCAAYAAALRKIGTPVDEILYPREQAILPHEYQFHMRRKKVQETFSRLCIFLDRTKN